MSVPKKATPKTRRPSVPVSSVARLAWLFAGAPADWTEVKVAAAHRATRATLLVEKHRHRAARLVAAKAFSDGLRAGLPFDIALRFAHEVRLEAAGYGWWGVGASSPPRR
jgi:hypothetical protein